MKKFAITLIVSGTILFFVGIFDVFDVPYNTHRADYFIWFGIPVAIMGIGLMAFTLYQESKNTGPKGHS